jgi:hypothetical protein
MYLQLQTVRVLFLYSILSVPYSRGQRTLIKEASVSDICVIHAMLYQCVVKQSR